MGKVDQRTESMERRLPRPARLAAGAGAALGATLAATGAAQAADFTVVNTDGDGPGSLRDAISQANANNNSATEVDNVLFQSGLSGTIHLNQPPGPGYGDLAIDEAVNIVGPGDGQITVSGDADSRVFYIDLENYGEPVSISGLRVIQGAEKYNRGGNILNLDADLTISGSSVKSGSAIFGAGIYNRGDLTVENSTISGNVASFSSGGLYSGGETHISGSTIANNAGGGKYGFGGGPGNLERVEAAAAALTEGSPRRANGGGGATIRGVGTIDNSTFTGNTTNGQGGGILHKYGAVDSGSQTLTVRSATISGNAAGSGGGIYTYTYNENLGFSPTVLENSIVAGNDADNPENGRDLGSANDLTFDAAFSLIQRPDGATVNDTGAGSNIFGLDPLLGALTDNGGPTRTMALLDASPALDNGRTPAGQTTDQRGLTRPVDLSSYPNNPAAGGDGADIGAFERQAPAPQGTCKGEPATVGLEPAGEITYGTAGRDVIVGDGNTNEIRGRGGDDLICGRGGQDILRGGPGDDEVLGEEGNDNVFGDQDDDTLRGGAGNDKLAGATGNDRAFGEAGQDRLTGSAGDDRLNGGPQDDVLIGAAGADVLIGGPGNDRLNGGKGVDQISGGPGRDQEIQQ
ncbi:MAG TPA: calcium-binding protein [Solirubrobacterales bacterium]|nr:calcium-binding protein [Solirubrobacterales bacterium]